MKMRILLLTISYFALTGCVTGYTLVEPGVRTIGDNLTVNASAGWNLAPSYAGGGGRKNTESWTRDGLLLDRLEFIPGIADGETIIVSADKSAALPAFRKDMLPNEIEELVESTIVKYFGEGQAAVSTSNLRPHKFGEHRGVLFDINSVVTDSPMYNGVVGAFIVNDELNIMWFFGAEPYYYKKHLAEAEAVIRSARLTSVSG